MIDAQITFFLDMIFFASFPYFEIIDARYKVFLV